MTSRMAGCRVVLVFIKHSWCGLLQWSTVPAFGASPIPREEPWSKIVCLAFDSDSVSDETIRSVDQMIRFSASLMITGAFAGLAAFAANSPPVVDGVVMPKRPVIEGVRDGMQFLKKGDGGYVP